MIPENLTPAQQREFNLMCQCKHLEAFEHEGRVYMGSYMYAIMDFIKNNPEPADFGVWLQQNRKEIL